MDREEVSCSNANVLAYWRPSLAAEWIARQLATIYNTLHQFTDAGLLQQVTVDGSKPTRKGRR